MSILNILQNSNFTALKKNYLRIFIQNLQLQTKMDQNGNYTTQTDAYNGIHIRLQQNASIQEIVNLSKSCEKGEENFKAVWIYFTTEKYQLLDELVNKRNYKIHHALGKDITVYKWLRKNEDLTVPYSIFWVAAGAIVVKDGKILLVKQKGGARKGKYGLPGGRANRRELISQCAQRQLFQETGIVAKYKKIVYFRELSGHIYNSVDLYFACLMEIDQNSFNNFRLCQRQISAFQWVPLEEYQDFCNKNSFGTQVLVSKHVTKVYKQGKLLSNQGYQMNLNLEKRLCQHRL